MITREDALYLKKHTYRVEKKDQSWIYFTFDLFKPNFLYDRKWAVSNGKETITGSTIGEIFRTLHLTLSDRLSKVAMLGYLPGNVNFEDDSFEIKFTIDINGDQFVGSYYWFSDNWVIVKRSDIHLCQSGSDIESILSTLMSQTSTRKKIKIEPFTKEELHDLFGIN